MRNHTAGNNSLLAFLRIHLGRNTYPTARDKLNGERYCDAIDYAAGMLGPMPQSEVAEKQIARALWEISRTDIDLVKQGIITIDFSKLG